MRPPDAPAPLSVAHLPTHGSGSRMPMWWGTLGFVVIEGLGFVFAVATYLYLLTQNRAWPMAPPPGLLWGALFTLLIVASELPNWWTKKAAQAHDLRKVRLGVVTMSLVGALALVIRVFEFTALNVRWDDNAYGSIVWLLIGVHTAHLVTDVAETWVVAVMLYIGPLDMRRFSDVDDNQAYWDFVVLAWLPVYMVLYWLPRLVGGPP